ncbi:yjbQ, partial [Symbiodinium sp. KB8]
MAWSQHTVRVKAPKAGCHLITDDIVQAVPEIQQLKVGLANLFLQHTSAALTLNENCDPDVRKDMKAALERLAPRGGGAVKYKHDCEG